MAKTCSICGLVTSLPKGTKNQPVCLCRNRQKIASDLPFKITQLGGFHLQPIGIEIEAANWGGLAELIGEQRTAYFGICNGRFTHDGSVTSGYEWVSQIIQPFADNTDRTTMPEVLLDIADSLELNKVVFDKTCGYHVHVDARDWSWWQLAKVWYNFINIQNQMYLMCSPYRESVNPLRERTYCNRYTPKLAKLLRQLLYKSNAEVKRWMTDQLYTLSTEVLTDTARRKHRERTTRRYNSTNRPLPTEGVSAQDLLRAKSYKYHNNRYYGFNIIPWHHQGTVEYRMQGHPLTSEDIVMWPLLVCNITHRLLNGRVLEQPLVTQEQFLSWLDGPPVLPDYVIKKQLQFKTEHDAKLVTPVYKELV